MTDHLTQKDLKKLFVAFALYLTSLIAANTLGLKTMPFLFGTHVSVAVISFPIVFIMTDVVGEVYGKSIARLFVLGGAIATILFILFSVISVLLPWSDSSTWAQDGYDTLFTVTTRMGIASVVAFIVAEYQDIFTFFALKKKLGGGDNGSAGRLFWLRSNLSNIWSQFLDTVLWNTIAFAGVYSTGALGELILTWWLYKIAMGIVYTPLSYLGIALLKK